MGMVGIGRVAVVACIALTLAAAGEVKAQDSKPAKAPPQAANASSISKSDADRRAPNTQLADQAGNTSEAEAPANGESQGADADKAGAKSKVKQLARAIIKIPSQMRAMSKASRTLFERASAAFPSFCQDWERKLHAREVNNVSKLTLQQHDGWETGTYLGYSKIKSCFTKASTGGVPIGELTYQEIEYYVTGKTSDQAMHATPKPVSYTNTTEIFRWDKAKTKWSYE